MLPSIHIVHTLRPLFQIAYHVITHYISPHFSSFTTALIIINTHYCKYPDLHTLTS